MESRSTAAVVTRQVAGATEVRTTREYTINIEGEMSMQQNTNSAPAVTSSKASPDRHTTGRRSSIAPVPAGFGTVTR